MDGNKYEYEYEYEYEYTTNLSHPLWLGHPKNKW
jgi:hypothetical protein